MTWVPLVSVIVPAYNHEDYVVECLESILNQTYPRLEILVYDDGSTDETPRRIATVVERHPERFRYISKDNEGLCATLNRGLADASGKYIAIIASDDVWLPERVARQVEFMEAHPDVGLCHSDARFLRFTERTEQLYSTYKPSIRRHFSQPRTIEETYRALLLENLVIASTVLLRAAVIEQVGQFDSSLTYEDYDMWLRIAEVSRLAWLDEPLAYYRTHDANVSNSASLMLRGAVQALRKQYATGPLRGHPVQIARAFLGFLATVGRNRLVRMTGPRRSS